MSYKCDACPAGFKTQRGLENHRPLKNGWKNGKISHEEISRFIPDFPKRSNSEMRDAALLLWVELGKPIKI